MASLASATDDSTRDRLTGLATLDHARKTLDRWWREWPAGGTGCPIHVMLISVGRIDRVNVAFGETAGDGALIEIAQRIRHFAGDELESGVWTAARSSGDTFLLALREECNRERWQWLAEALADAIAMPINDPDTGHSLRLWPRVALIRAVEGDTSASVLDTLSEASARIRSLQGHRVVWTSGELAKDGRSSQQLEADLLAAIDRDEIAIRFQPQYSLETDRLIGAEALARWDHPVLGRVGAATLFTIAERADHTAQLSRHIAQKALEAARAWPEGLRLSINVTPADLAAGSFAREFLALVDANGIDPHSLTLEITEQVLLADLEQVSGVLAELKARGISLSLDDFGAGFCNFRYLKVLPIDHLKLDRSMIEGVLEDERDLAVFRAIVAMAKALDLKVVVEGVENEAQRVLIAREGCEVYQGFLRAEPMPAEEFLALASR